MLCYCCAKDGIEEPAVALCRSCKAGLCLHHLRETTARAEARNVLNICHHDTWAVSKKPPRALRR